LVSALQEKGHKVAMTGDGVNDILALKKADCSIAMASGSSAARNVAHIVSLDNDFSKLA
jgi:cation-transporting ATPase E